MTIFHQRQLLKYFKPIYNQYRFGNFLPLNYNYICNPENKENIENIISVKKSSASIQRVLKLNKKLSETTSPSDALKIKTELENATLHIPNIFDPSLNILVPKVLETCNNKPEFNYQTKDFDTLTKKMKLIIHDKKLDFYGGGKTYYITNKLAMVERALIRCVLDILLKRDFTMLSVPNILSADILEKAGMPTSGHRSQVYKLSDTDNLCLAGTAEQGICGYLQDKVFDEEELPQKYVAISRCYRSEVPSNVRDKGIYRVNQFTKVEMFGVTANETGLESQQLYNQFIEIQKEFFSSLGLHFQVVLMPPNQLGDNAYTKTDIEAWMSHLNFYGEISSTSNCTDYQSRRFNIMYRNKNGQLKPTHTCNGTACAVPRMLMALVLQNQTEEGHIKIPEVLQPLMKNISKIEPHIPKNGKEIDNNVKKESV